MSDLEQKSDNSPDNKSSKGLYIGLAVIAVLAIGIIAWLLLRNKQEVK